MPGKNTKFIPAIPLPDGSELTTLEDAAKHIQNLPAKQFKTAHWQFAGYEVVAAIEGRSTEMFARIAFMRALAGRAPGAPVERPEPKPGVKDPVYRGRKKRDAWR